MANQGSRKKLKKEEEEKEEEEEETTKIHVRTATKDDQQFYAFLSAIDGECLTFECTPKDWMDNMWNKLCKNEASKVIQEYLNILEAKQKPSDEILAKMGTIHSWYSSRIDAELFIYQYRVSDGLVYRDHLTKWFYLAVTSEIYEETEGALIDESGKEEKRSIVHLEEISEKDVEISQGVFQALHSFYSTESRDYFLPDSEDENSC